MSHLVYWQQIERDLEWRQKELASLKILVLTSNEPTQKVLLRSLLAMLYAHFQGFCINALVVYAKAICDLGEPIKMHNNPIIVTSLTGVFKKVKTMSDSEIFEFVNYGFNNAIESSVSINQEEFETSNLYPRVLTELCAKVGLDCPEITIRETLVKSLVGRRNAIAHGQESDVRDLKEYSAYEDAATDVMCSLALSIEESMRERSYLKV